MTETTGRVLGEHAAGSPDLEGFQGEVAFNQSEEVK